MDARRQPLVKVGPDSVLDFIEIGARKAGRERSVESETASLGNVNAIKMIPTDYQNRFQKILNRS